MKNTSIIIADSEYLIRVGLRHVLENQPTYKIVSEVVNEESLFYELATKQTDIIVMDYNQPGAFTTATVDKLKKEFPKVKLLVISGDDDKKNIYQVLEKGVSSYLSKRCDEKEIINAIRATSSNEKYYLSLIHI